MSDDSAYDELEAEVQRLGGLANMASDALDRVRVLEAEVAALRARLALPEDVAALVEDLKSEADRLVRIHNFDWTDKIGPEDTKPGRCIKALVAQAARIAELERVTHEQEEFENQPKTQEETEKHNQ